MGTGRSGLYHGTRGSGGSSAAISPQTVEHSSKGNFMTGSRTYAHPRLVGGGHGQENIDYLDRHNIPYTIVKTYSNGVRVGNIPSHLQKQKRTGSMQAWFPATWNKSDIESAGNHVSSIPGNQLPDGQVAFGVYNGVRVGIIRTNGDVATIFPDADQQPLNNQRR